MDPDLVVRAQQGDEVAFETLAVASQPRLYRLALGILRDSQLAEDATEQALVDIWRYLRRLRDVSKFEAWSYRLLVRACYAESKRRTKVVATSPMQPTDESHAPDPFLLVADRDQLEHGFQYLSLEHRAVIVLRYLLDLPLEQVAEALDIPVGTVGSRLNRAMQSLRAALDADARTSMPLVTSGVTRR
jgi:RNA polymerase sigma-70 factor (ECF subfamily)